MAPAILLVDDSEIVVEALLRWLNHDGYEVVVANNCAEVRAITAKRHFAVHIFDLQLSDGDGVELALSLRSSGHTATTIFYTGHAVGSAPFDRAEHVGHIVAKGAHPNALLRVLRTIFDPEREDEHRLSTR